MFHHSINPRLDWVLFLLVYFKTWLNCDGQLYCDNIAADDGFVFDHIEPIEITSGGEAVKIYYNVTMQEITWNVNAIKFTHISTPETIITCKDPNLTTTTTLITVHCETEPISSSMAINFEYNSSLNLISELGCLTVYNVYAIRTSMIANSNRLVDPHITNLPSYLFYNHSTIFEIVYLVKHPNHNITLESLFTQCNQLNLTLNRALFMCNYIDEIEVRYLELNVKINGKNYKKFYCNVYPAPILTAVVGSTFGKANNPIWIFGNHFSAMFSDQIYLITELTSKIKCLLVNSTCIRCFFGLDVKPVNVKTQISFAMLFDEFNEFTNQGISFPLNPNPKVIKISYSLSKNLLYIYFIHFSIHYKPFTTLHIFDPNRDSYLPCHLLPEIQYYHLICRPLAKLSEHRFNRVHVNINISLWIISYKDVVRLSDEPDPELTQHYIYMVASLIVILVFITCVCAQLAKYRHSKIMKPQRMKKIPKSIGSFISTYLKRHKERLQARYEEKLKRYENARAEQEANQSKPKNPKKKKKIELENLFRLKRKKKSDSLGKGKEKRKK